MTQRRRQEESDGDDYWEEATEAELAPFDDTTSLPVNQLPHRRNTPPRCYDPRVVGYGREGWLADVQSYNEELDEERRRAYLRTLGY